MIIFIYGEDTFRSRHYLKNQIVHFKQTRDPQGYNVVFLDGKKEEERIVSEIMAVPFLAERRMIVVENMLSSSDKEVLAEIITRVKNNTFPESNVIVFWQGEALGKTREVKELKELLVKQKYSQEFVVLKGQQLKAWAEQELYKRGGSIEPEALTCLFESCGEDTWLMNSTIDQLVAFARGSMITVAMVESIIDKKNTTTIFDLVEAIVGQNHKRSYELLLQERVKGGEEGMLGMLIWQVRILLEMRDVFEREEAIQSDIMAKQIGVHPFVVKKNWSVMKRYSLSALKRAYQALLEIDIKTKTGLVSQSVLIDLFVARS